MFPGVAGEPVGAGARLLVRMVGERGIRYLLVAVGWLFIVFGILLLVF